MDHLLRLSEEFNFAGCAAALRRGPGRTTGPGIMVANAHADAADFVDYAEVERPTPDEQLIASRKCAKRTIAGARRSG